MQPAERQALEATLETVRPHAPGALLPALHDLQDRLRYIPSAAIAAIAKAMNLSRAEVHGVVSFYPHFRTSKPGRHLVRICRAEACQAMGAVDLLRHAETTLGIESGATTADASITLEPVYCLGNCGCAPAMMVDDDLHGRVNAAHFDLVVLGLRDHT